MAQLPIRRPSRAFARSCEGFIVKDPNGSNPVTRITGSVTSGTDSRGAWSARGTDGPGSAPARSSVSRMSAGRRVTTTTIADVHGVHYTVDEQRPWHAVRPHRHRDGADGGRHRRPRRPARGPS